MKVMTPTCNSVQVIVILNNIGIIIIISFPILCPVNNNRLISYTSVSGLDHDMQLVHTISGLHLVQSLCMDSK